MPITTIAASNETRRRDVDILEVIVKVSERCNIACKYCYFFFGGDDSYKENPAAIKDTTVQQFIGFIEKAVKTHAMRIVRVILHGGEPLLLKKSKMEQLLIGIEQATPGVELQLTIQTNAMLIDEEWIALFSRYKVQVGVSLDGPQDVNDVGRIDKKGRGTYERTMAGVRLLFDAFKRGEILKPGLLCVLNPTVPLPVLYHHFVNELDFRHVDFLLPDSSHESAQSEELAYFPDNLRLLVRLYMSEKKKGVRIRLVDKVIEQFCQPPDFAANHYQEVNARHVVFTVQSNGAIAPDDILRVTDPALMSLDLNVASNSLEDVNANVKLQELVDMAAVAPEACGGCEWVNVCRGGALYHRYSKSRGFNNRSIYCQALKVMHSEVAEMLMRAGMPAEVLEARLLAAPKKAATNPVRALVAS